MQERERFHRRKKDGKIKTIGDLTRREQKSQRKKWKESSRKYREVQKINVNLTKFLQSTSPPSSPAAQFHEQSPSSSSSNILLSTETSKFNQTEYKRFSMPISFSDQSMSDKHLCTASTSQSKIGRKKIRRDRTKGYRKINKLEGKVKKLEKKCNKYKTKYYRLLKSNENANSPKTKIRKMLRGRKIPYDISRRLIYNEAINTQLEVNYNELKSRCNRRTSFSQMLSGKILSKYRLKHSKSFLSFKPCNVLKSKNKLQTKEKIKKIIQHSVQSFLERDECSRMCPGKKDTITRTGMKIQKRLFNDTLQNLYKIFIHGNYCIYKISYQTFCKIRPFWIVPPRISERDTCLCIHHENVHMIVNKLKFLKIISEDTPEAISNNLSCESACDREACLTRICTQCANKQINVAEYQKEEIITYEKWVKQRVVKVVKGKEKVSNKTVKDTFSCTKAELVDILRKAMPNFMQHLLNVKHQYAEMDGLKKQLKSNEAIIHMDFSENYNMKYAKEIQSVHFGSSRGQVTLHTVMIYYKVTENSNIKKKAFCTISDSLQHDAIAICSHLKPILSAVSTLIPALKKIHFLSDGPSGQYRNRNMFYLMTYHLSQDIKEMTWNYSEAGHGKGAPDGIGACIKRSVDALVAMGKDITNIEVLVEMLNSTVTGINIIKILKFEVENSQVSLPNNTPVFKGTMKTHQVVWHAQNPHVLQFRKLSCFKCHTNENCSHYGIGRLDFTGMISSVIENKFECKNICSSSSCDDDDDLLKLKPFPIVPQSGNCIKLNDFVIVKFATKKSVKHYVGTIISFEEPGEYNVKFLRRQKDNTFVYPIKDDISMIAIEDMEGILNEPDIGRRDTYVFFNDLSAFANLL